MRKRTRRDKKVFEVCATWVWHLQLYACAWFKCMLETALYLGLQAKEKSTYTHGMSCKRGMHFSTPPSQPRQGVATYFLLQVQLVRVTTHLP